MCRKLYEATGGSIQLEKSFYYLWIQKVQNGKQVLVDCNNSIKIKDEDLKQILAKQSIRVLRVCITPSLD